MTELIEGKLCSEYHILSNNAITEPRRSHVSRLMMKERASDLVLTEHRICRERKHCTNSITLIDIAFTKQFHQYLSSLHARPAPLPNHNLGTPFRSLPLPFTPIPSNNILQIPNHILLTLHRLKTNLILLSWLEELHTNGENKSIPINALIFHLVVIIRLVMRSEIHLHYTRLSRSQAHEVLFVLVCQGWYGWVTHFGVNVGNIFGFAVGDVGEGNGCLEMEGV